MSTPFLSSEEYDERAHRLYSEGKYDEALNVLRQGLSLYPASVELHVGEGYARLAREEYAWARRSFEEAVALDSEHEDALAGLAETLLKFGEEDRALANFRRILELGYEDDVELIIQVGRALFREGMFDEAHEFFTVAARQAPESAEVAALMGYTQHRMGDDDGAIASLRRALQLDSDYVEGRVYLANLLYDRREHHAALYHLDRTSPEDHWDELGIWRLIELKKTIHRLKEDDAYFTPWMERLAELEEAPDATDAMLAEIEQRVEEEIQHETRNQLELFGALLGDLATRAEPKVMHRVETRDGRPYEGEWDDIVAKMRDASDNMRGRSVQEFMQNEARRGYSLTGVLISTRDSESFLRGSADAGLLRIIR